MSELNKLLFRSQTQVFIAENLNKTVEESLKSLNGQKVLFIIDQNISQLEDVQNLFKWTKNSFETFEHVVESKEPGVEFVDEQVSAVKSFQPDVVVGIGGGSVLDLSKAVSVLIYNEGKAAEYQGPNLIKNPGAKKIMIPTTAGTGSEVTPGAVVTNYETGRKGAISSPYVTPEIAILAPSLTVSMPEHVMVATAMDAMTHCIESYCGRFYNPFADIYAKEGFRYLINAFEKVVNDPKDLNARREMLIGSTMGGFAIFNTDTGASHAMAYPLGTHYGVPHGLANALLIPWVIEHNVNGGYYRYADLYDQYENRDITLSSSRDKSKALENLLRYFLDQTSIAKNFNDYGIKEENIDEMAEKGLNLKTALNNTPIEFKFEDGQKILKELVTPQLERIS